MNTDNKKILRLRILILALLLANAINQAQGQEYKYEIGGHLGTTYYSGDAISRGVFSRHGLSMGVMMRSNPTFRWSWVSSLSYGYILGDTRLSGSVFPSRQDVVFSTNIINLSVGGEYHWWALSNKYRYLSTRSWSPYIGGGVGAVLGWEREGYTIVPSLYASVGVKYKLSSRWTASAQWVWQYTFTDKLDALSAGSTSLSNPYRLNSSALKGNDALGSIGINLTYLFGRRDSGGCD